MIKMRYSKYVKHTADDFKKQSYKKSDCSHYVDISSWKKVPIDTKIWKRTNKIIFKI